MGPEVGRTAAPVGEQLFDRPWSFDFFRAVQILELLAGERGGDRPPGALPVGGDEAPENEAVRFRASPTLGFPGSPVLDLVRPPAPPPPPPGVPPAPERPPEMTVGFLGLTGPCGALPDHYSLLLNRAIRLKDTAFRDFADLFNHRTLSLFFRAWEKYRLAPGYERARRRRAEDDFISWVLSCLVGRGTGGIRGRQAVPDEAFVFYGGTFSRSVRTAATMQRTLSAYFQVPVEVEQFRGRWIHLDPEDRSRLPSAAEPRGRQNLLGVDFVLGDRCWDLQGGIRLRVGPVFQQDFLDLMPAPVGGVTPEGPMLRPFCELARTFAGPDLDFDIQVLLPAEEAPPCVLGVEGPGAAVLGWCAWLRSGEMEGVLEDAVFGGSPLS